MWQEVAKKALLKKASRNLAELGLLFWVVLECVYNVSYWDSSTPAPFIVELQFMFLVVSFVNIRHVVQKHYYMPIIGYYVFTIASQILIKLGAYDVSIHIIDMIAFIACVATLICIIFKIKK